MCPPVEVDGDHIDQYADDLYEREGVNLERKKDEHPAGVRGPGEGLRQVGEHVKPEIHQFDCLWWRIEMVIDAPGGSRNIVDDAHGWSRVGAQVTKRVISKVFSCFIAVNVALCAEN